MVQRIGGIGQFHEIAEILDRAITPPLVEAAHEWWAGGGRENRPFAADHDVTRRVAGDLGEFARGVGLDQGATHATRHLYQLACHLGAGCAPDLQCLGIVAEFHADLCQNRLCIGLDQAEALVVQHVEKGQSPTDIGGRNLHRAKPCRPFGVAPAGSAARRCLGCLGFRHGRKANSSPSRCRMQNRMISITK